MCSDMLYIRYCSHAVLYVNADFLPCKDIELLIFYAFCRTGPVSTDLSCILYF